MALTTLKPRLASVNTNRVTTLQAKAGTTPRIRGSAWMKTRKAVMQDGEFACVDCGTVSQLNEVDHDVPLEQGGSNDRSNLVVRCTTCHKAKTSREAASRHSM